MRRVGPALATILGLTVAAGIGPAAVAQAPLLPAPEFHHLHLNSVNPEAAIDFYTRQFPATSKETFAGQPALKSPTDVLVLFTRVATPPATEPPTAFWHFGWHVTDVRASLERFTQQGVTLLPLYREEAGSAGHR
jgi:catechol 2,3-dioxygenase-like lactoylglutathione lyase family enzyme